MRRQAQAMAKGNFSRKVRVYGNDEIGQLAIAFNHLTNRLQESNLQQKLNVENYASVLENMTDGVIATDRKGRVILINDPALRYVANTKRNSVKSSNYFVLGIDTEYAFEDLIHMKDSVNLILVQVRRPYILRANFSVTQKETGFVNGLNRCIA